MAANQEMAELADDPTCAQFGCMLSTCFPCVGCFTYCVNRSATGENTRRWALRALGTPFAILAFVYAVGSYFGPPATPPPPPLPPAPWSTTNTTTTSSPSALVELVNVQSLQPWYLVPISSALMVLVQFGILGFDVKTSRQDGCFARCCKRCRLDGLLQKIKVASSLAFSGMALSTMRQDWRQVWNVVQAGAEWRTILATVVAVGVTSSNFKASMVIHGTVRVQNPSNFFGKPPPYATCPGFFAGLPLSPWGSPWLPWHKWLYFALLQIYRAPLLLAHACLLAVFFVLWGFPWLCASCFHTHLHGCIPNVFRSGWLIYLYFLFFTLVMCWFFSYVVSITCGLGLLLFLANNSPLTQILFIVFQIWGFLGPGLDFLALSLWCHCFPLLLSGLLSCSYGAQEMFKQEASRRPEVIVSRLFWRFGARLLCPRRAQVEDPVEDGSLGRPRRWLLGLCCFCLSPLQFFLPVFLALFEQRRPHEVYSGELWDELWSYQNVPARQVDVESEIAMTERTRRSSEPQSGLDRQPATYEIPMAPVGETPEFKAFVSEVKFLIIFRTLLAQSSIVIHQMSLLILARWFAGHIESARPPTLEDFEATGLYFIHACQTTISERQMASFVGYNLDKLHHWLNFLQHLQITQSFLYFMSEILPVVSNIL